jgi:predicted O-methyltransferase YrrM
MKVPFEIFRDLLPGLLEAMPAAGEDSGYALPEATLTCLANLVRSAGIQRVFEFGSGRSTKIFLQAGCRVTSLEDSERWLHQTRQTITPEDLGRHHAVVQPLRTVWHRAAPMKSWTLSAELRRALEEAELVLIDSPASPPFREHPLILALTLARQATVVIDDANIPTVQRFCQRLARNDAALASHFTPKDHGLYFFGLRESRQRIDFSRGVIETGKAWRRFWMNGQAPGAAS